MKIFSFIITIASIIVILIVPRDTIAQTKTPSPSPQISEEKEIDTIEKIKDLVASKVAELKLVDKRGILGLVKRSSNSQIVVEDFKRDQRSVDIDELTKFISSKESFGISDIKEGDRISVIGLYNKETKRILARFVSLSANIPTDIEGVVVSKDKPEFSFTIFDSNGKQKDVDVETSTKTNVWNGDTLSKSGFSRIENGERVLVVGFNDPNDDNIINASRVIHFPDLVLGNALEKHKSNTVEEDIPASTRSAR